MSQRTAIYILVGSAIIWLLIFAVILVKINMGVYDTPSTDGAFLLAIPTLETAYIWERGGRIQRKAGLL